MDDDTRGVRCMVLGCGACMQNVTVTNTAKSGDVQFMISTPANPAFITAPYV
jgi:hypothetical protein